MLYRVAGDLTAEKAFHGIEKMFIPNKGEHFLPQQEHDIKLRTKLRAFPAEGRKAVFKGLLFVQRNDLAGCMEPPGPLIDETTDLLDKRLQIAGRQHTGCDCATRCLVFDYLLYGEFHIEAISETMIFPGNSLEQTLNELLRRELPLHSTHPRARPEN